MMSSCLTKETHQTAQDSLLTESETSELEAGEQSFPRTTKQSLRNGHVEAIVRLSTS